MTDAEALGRKLLEIRRLCEAGRAVMTPAERDAHLQRFLAQATGSQGRLRGTLDLCEAGMALRRMQERQARGGRAE